MKLSIIIPVYNCEKYIKNCIDSLIESKGEFEVIIVNDGSTDETLKIAESYILNYNNIRVINIESNTGVSNARNIGLESALGEYIMFMDADDWLSNGWNNIVFENLNSKDDIIFFNNKISIHATKDNILNNIFGNSKEKAHMSGPHSKIFKTSLIRDNNIIFKKEIINGEDMLFNAEALINANNYVVINNEFYNIRRHVGSLSRKFDEYIFISEMLFQEELKRILKDYPDKEELIEWCDESHIINVINRIAYIDDYKNAYVFFKNLEEQKYQEILNRRSKCLKRKIICCLLRHKFYYIVFIIYRLKLKINIKTNRKSF